MFAMKEDAMPTTTETAEMQDTSAQTTQATQTGPSQQTGSRPAAGAESRQEDRAKLSRSTPPADRGMSRRDPWRESLGNPFAMMQSFAQEMDRLFESFGFGRSSRLGGLDRRGGGSAERSQAPGLWAPQIEVSRRGNELVVCADLPGMKKEDLQVEVREDHLVLQGERRQEQEADEGGYYRSERSYGRFYRAIPLPEGTDPERAQANFRDGVLEIKMPLPQQAEQRSRQIEIR